MEKSQSGPEDFESIRLKRGIKARLEDIQTEIKRQEGKKPTLSKVVERLIDARESALDRDDGLASPSSGRANAYWHELLDKTLSNEMAAIAIQHNLELFAVAAELGSPAHLRATLGVLRSANRERGGKGKKKPA